MSRALTPLDQLTALTPDLRRRLADYWITSVEEFVAVTRSSNQQYGSGRAALAVALGVSEDDLRALVNAAMPLLPSDVSFSVPVEQELGAGLLLDEYVDAEPSFSVPTNLPEMVEPLFTLPPPPSQGVRNSCVAFTLAAAYQVLSRDPTDLSEQFLYWACKERDGVPKDVGTDPLKAAAILQELGICTEATWPYAPAPSDHQNPGHGPPPPAAQEEAPLRRIERFEKLAAKGAAAIKQALADGKPVLIGLAIHEHWQGSWQGSVRGRLRQRLPGESSHGGHAMLAVGYRDDASAPGGGYFIVRNSWGSDWAKDNPDGPGLCHVPYRLITNGGLAAIALQGVAPQPAVAKPVPATVETSMAVPVAANPAPVTLDELVDEATALQARLKDLASLTEELGLRVNDLMLGLRQLRGDPHVQAAPVGAAAVSLSEDERAQTAQLADNLVNGVMGGPLIVMAQGSGTDYDDLAPNGIAPSGERLLQINAAALADQVKQRGAGDPPERLSLYRAKRTASSTGHLGTVADVAQGKIEEARWALVINALEDSALIKALWPLMEHRMRQMGMTPPTVSFRDGENATTWMSRHSNNFQQNLKDDWGKIPPVLIYRHTTSDGPEKVGRWLSRHGVSNGPVDPRRGVPFYLLIVGRPGPLAEGDRTAISFDFQYELDIFWGVGRVCFTDERGQHRIKDYQRFAERLVATEQRQDAAARLRKDLVLFATKHEGDLSTIRSADELVGSLAQWHANPSNLPTKTGFGLQSMVEAPATRTGFEQLLKGDGRAPAILFTASHGLGLPLSDQRLVHHQGALVLQDWNGTGNVKREHWYAGEDLAQCDPNLEGTAACVFACYGGGCPTHDEFIFEPGKPRPPIAPFAMVAQLPQQLLLAGSIGVIAHVERAWTFSFSGTEGTRAQSQPFEDVLGRLMQGRRLGDALDQFDVLRGARAMTLAKEIEDIEFNKKVPPLDLARLWMAFSDARNYALIGDPAARLPY
ncbi:MAG: C1 family peptidase [Oscillochloridaceae bacterium umkhey_bin13]